jgi:hypothetical protein
VSRSAERRRASWFVAATLALFAVVALVLLLTPRPAPPEPTAQRAPASPGAERRGASSPLPGGARVTSRSGPAGSGSVSLPFDPHDTPMVPPALPSARFPYPPGSQPLTDGVDPAMQAKENVPVDPDTGITCSFGPRVAIVHPADPLVIDLVVRNRLGAAMPISDAAVRFRTEQADPEKGPWIPVPLVDDGSGRDLAAGDHEYTATLAPTEEQQTALTHGGGVHLYVEAAFEAPNGLGKRRYMTTMQYSREPDAKLSGTYTDQLQSGSLVIAAGVTATAAGEYRVIGSLYGGASAVAFASKSVHLDVGDGTVPLLFFGKILHDRGIDGPYELRYAMLFERDGADEIAGETVDPAYTTHAYAAKSFSDDAYAQPTPTFEAVDMNSPSQQGKPPPLFSDDDRKNLRGPTAPIRADPPATAAQPTPTGTK